MANDGTNPFGNTNTFGAGVGVSDHSSNNINWYAGSALGTEDDLFGQFLHSTPKISDSYCDPNDIFGNHDEANIDPSLRTVRTDLPPHSDHSVAGASAQQLNDGSHWNLPPMGDPFWETFAFWDYMAAVGIRNDGQDNPAKFVGQPLGDNAGIGFQPVHQTYLETHPSQYGEPDYHSAVPGYGAEPEQHFGNQMQTFGPFSATQQQSNPFQLLKPGSFHAGNGQMSFGGAPMVDSWISSENPFAGSLDMSGLGLSLPGHGKFYSNVIPAAERQTAAVRSTWDADLTEGENSPRPIKGKAAKGKGANGKKPNARAIAAEKALAKAKDVYEQRPRQGNLVIQDQEAKRPHTFRYTHFGELDGFFSTKALRAYMLHKFQGSRHQHQEAMMLVQCVPADSGNRYPSAGVSDKCRLANCAAKNHTIAQGTFRVALDEFVNPSKFDPFHTAGFVHLYCLERFFNLQEIVKLCCILPDTRQLKRGIEDDNGHSRLHINRTSTKNEKTVLKFLDALESGKKLATGYDGAPFDYRKTLCWLLTRNTTADLPRKRSELNKQRHGVNMFVHFNDEEQRIFFTEQKRNMPLKEFQEWMDELMDQADHVSQVEGGGANGGISAPKAPSSGLAQRRDDARSSKNRKPSAALGSAYSETTDDAGVRRSPRLSKHSSRPSLAPIQTQQSRKRVRKLSDFESPADFDESPESVRPTKRARRNLPLTPMLPLSQGRLNSRSAGKSLPLRPLQEAQSSPLSPPPEWIAEFTKAMDSPLSPLPQTPEMPTPNVEMAQDNKRARQESDSESEGSLFDSSSDDASVRSRRPLKKLKYTR